ncbi:TPA: hypothetical protein KQJ50_001416 [Clostridioides difficile]|nr:hypothetical protein [Clostridioides difficile]
MQESSDLQATNTEERKRRTKQNERKKYDCYCACSVYRRCGCMAAYPQEEIN